MQLLQQVSKVPLALHESPTSQSEDAQVHESMLAPHGLPAQR